MEPLIVEDVKPAINLSASTVSGIPAITNVTITSSSPSQRQAGFVLSITKRFTLEAAHRLPKHPGKCFNMHGHSYKLEVTMTGLVNKDTGMIEDFDELNNIVKTLIINKYDHQTLNEYYETPTAENLALFWLKNLRGHDSRFVKLTVWETESSSATASYVS